VNYVLWVVALHHLDLHMAIALENIGQRLYEARATYMVETRQGLTQTYNKLKDPECNDPEILHLRELHLEMDRAVLTAYGWTDLLAKVPPFPTPHTEAEKRALAAFEDAVIDRLFALNAERAAAEALAGHGTKPPKPVRLARKPATRAPTAQLDLKPRGH
jgi:hypothetical protein